MSFSINLIILSRKKLTKFLEKGIDMVSPCPLPDKKPVIAKKRGYFMLIPSFSSHSLRKDSAVFKRSSVIEGLGAGIFTLNFNLPFNTHCS